MHNTPSVAYHFRRSICSIEAPSLVELVLLLPASSLNPWTRHAPKPKQYTCLGTLRASCDKSAEQSWSCVDRIWGRKL